MLRKNKDVSLHEFSLLWMADNKERCVSGILIVQTNDKAGQVDYMVSVL